MCTEGWFDGNEVHRGDLSDALWAIYIRRMVRRNVYLCLAHFLIVSPLVKMQASLSLHHMQQQGTCCLYSCALLWCNKMLMMLFYLHAVDRVSRDWPKQMPVNPVFMPAWVAV